MQELLVAGYLDTTSGFEHYLNSFDHNTCRQFEYVGVLRYIDALVYRKQLGSMLNTICQLDLQDINDKDFKELVYSLIDKSVSLNSKWTPQPREKLARVMRALLFDGKETNSSNTVYDPVCGSALLLNNIVENMGKNAPMLFGQDNSGSAVGLANLISKCIGGSQNYVAGDTLVEDVLEDQTFDYVVATLPFNLSWCEDDRMLDSNRYPAGFPARSDATLLFVQHIISKMNKNGRALFTCAPKAFFTHDETSCHVRSWLLANDYLDSIILLPLGMVPGPNVRTFLCVLDKNKPEHRRGKVQIINAEMLWPVKKDGTAVVDEVSIHQLWGTYSSFEDSKVSHIIDNDTFDVFSLDVIQPKRNTKGEAVIKNGQMVADKSKTITVCIPATEQDIIGYVKENVLNHADGDAWVDFSSVKRLCVINPYQYFEEKEAQRPIEDIEMDMLVMKREMIELMSVITEQPQVSSMVSEPIQNCAGTCILSAIADIQKPSSSKAINYLNDGMYPILTVRYLRGEEEPTQFTNSLEKHVLVEDGDIVMIANGVNAGEILNGKKGCLSGTLMKITPNSDSVLPEYVKLLLQAKKQEIDSLAKGAVIKSINISAISSLQLPVPPLSVQQEVVDKLAKKINAIDKLMPMLGGKARQTMTEYRQALITDAVLG